MKIKKTSLLATLLAAVLIACVIVAFTTSAKKSERMVYIMGQLYIATNQDVSEAVLAEMEKSELDSPYIGVIESKVGNSKLPSEELQSNFGNIGSEIISNGKGIAVNMGSKWIQFETEDNMDFDSIINNEDSSILVAALIKNFTEDAITVDIVEFITDEDTDRKNELIEKMGLREGNDLSEGNFLDGYYIYNPGSETTEWKITEKTVYTFIDWHYEYTGLDYPEYYTTMDAKKFHNYGNASSKMPYFFEVENGVVKNILEKPIP